MDNTESFSLREHRSCFIIHIQSEDFVYLCSRPRSSPSSPTGPSFLFLARSLQRLVFCSLPACKSLGGGASTPTAFSTQSYRDSFQWRPQWTPFPSLHLDDGGCDDPEILSYLRTFWLCQHTWSPCNNNNSWRIWTLLAISPQLAPYSRDSSYYGALVNACLHKTSYSAYTLQGQTSFLVIHILHYSYIALHSPHAHHLFLFLRTGEVRTGDGASTSPSYELLTLLLLATTVF